MDFYPLYTSTVCDLEETFQVMSLEENHAVSAMQNEKDKFCCQNNTRITIT